MYKKKTPKANLEEIMPLLIGVWRRFHKEAGPGDRLQTREFRSVVDAVKKLQQGLETGKGLIGQNYFSNPELLDKGNDPTPLLFIGLVKRDCSKEVYSKFLPSFVAPQARALIEQLQKYEPKSLEDPLLKQKMTKKPFGISNF